MASNKLFKPEFRTRDGKTVSFGANYTHDTGAKRRAGLTKAGKLKQTAQAGGQRARERRRWVPWTIFGANSAVLGGAYVVNELGPVPGSLVLGGGLYAGYKVVRWGAGEWAYFAVKRRQIVGKQQAQELDEGPSLDDIIASAPGTKVNYPGGKR